MVKILLFLFSSNFFSYANYMMILLLIYEVVIKRHFVLIKVKTSTFVYLIVASLSFMFFSIYNGYEISTSSFILKFIAPIVLYYIGFVRGLSGYKLWKTDVIVIMFATFTHGFLNVIVNRNVNVLQIAGRQYQDIYGGAISATLQNLMFVLSSALLFYFFVYEKNKILKILGVFAALAGAYGSIANASRTLLYVIVIVFFMCLFLHLMLNANAITGFIRGCMIASGILIVLLVVVWLNLFGIQEWFAGTALGQREATATSTSSVAQNLRWTYAGDILRLLPKYPLGNVPYLHYAHNLWVDIAKEGGIIPFVLYILFAIFSVFEGVRYMWKKREENEKVIFVAAIFAANILVFFTEPIMEGSPMTFSIFCFLVGGVSSLLKKLEN